MTSPQNFSDLGPVGVAIGDNWLHIYIYGLIRRYVTLYIGEMVVRGLQGAGEVTVTLPHFKPEILYKCN